MLKFLHNIFGINLLQFVEDTFQQKTIIVNKNSCYLVDLQVLHLLQTVYLYVIVEIMLFNKMWYFYRQFQKEVKWIIIG